MMKSCLILSLIAISTASYAQTNDLNALIPSFDNGTAGSLCNAGLSSWNGDGVPKNMKTAVELFQQAADRGDAAAQYNLGVCYEQGKVVPKNLAKAAELYQKAAINAGDTAKKAYSLISNCIYNGITNSADLVAARELLKKALYK